MNSVAWTLIFALALAASLGLRAWLASRQVRHVARHRDAVPAPFRDTVDLVSHHRAADYTLARIRLGQWQMAFGAVTLLGWTLFGGLDLLNATLLDAVLPRWGSIAYGVALFAAVLAIEGLLHLPLDLYATFGIEARFGFNRMTWRLWIADAIKGVLLAIVIGGPLVALVLWIMAASGPLWWLWAWVAWAAFNLIALVLVPTLIAPLFNRFEPLRDAPLEARVRALMARAGFAAKGLFVMDGSRRSAHGNAYFTGFGAARRIVFFDTLLARLQPEEVEAVLAHELGHFKLRHVLKRTAWFGLGSLAFLALLGWLVNAPWFYAGLGVPGPAPRYGVALVLFMLTLPVFTFLASPIASLYSRRHEFEADHYAAQNASAKALVAALVKLYEDNANTLTPDPLHSAFYDSHPPAAARIARLDTAIA